MSQESPRNPPPPAAPPVDSSSQALAEALRGSFAIVKFAMVVLLGVFLFSGFFTVGPQERAVILRFGRPVGVGDRALLGPGGHWAWPYPIDEVVKVPITEYQKITTTIGWYAITPEQEASGEEPPQTATLYPGVDGYVITADGNIVHSRATVRYRITDPIQCIFGFVDSTNGGFSLTAVSNAVLNAANNALVYSAARFTVDDLLTRDVTRFKETVEARLKDLVQDEQLGVVIDQCNVESRPPRQVKGAFESVTAASQARQALLFQARNDAFQVVSRADANAASITNLAVSASTNLVQSIAGEADKFDKLLPLYEGNPDLFKQIQFMQTMGVVLTNLEDKIYLPTTPDGKPIQLRLLLNRELPKPNPAATVSQRGS
jgi:modulator of FtsH protease HflK